MVQNRKPIKEIVLLVHRVGRRVCVVLNHTLNSLSRSDPQAWLSCHFNVDERVPTTAFNHASSRPIESSVQKITV